MPTSSLNHLSLATLVMFSGAVLLHPAPSEARPGMRGGAATSVSRPHGGAGGGGAQMANRGGAAGAGSQVSGGNRVSGGTSVSGGTRVNGGTTVRGGNTVNTGNVRVGNDVNVNVDNRGGWGGYGYDDHYHPVATGVAIGATAAVTSAVVGSMMYSLPPACSPRPYSGMTYYYYYCGNVWYAPQYQGDQVVYVVVNAPG